MAGHTQGPWARSGRVVRRRDEKRMGHYIARVLTMGDEAHADARLIAAAPDLLAALEELVKATYEDDYRAALDQSSRAIHLAKHGATIAPAQAEQS